MHPLISNYRDEILQSSCVVKNILYVFKYNMQRSWRDMPHCTQHNYTDTIRARGLTDEI
jgi:hypothetical protein